jgi:hypothetical protein
MHGSEDQELAECMDCGATVSPGTDRAFAMNDTMCLCFACAIARGGVYDEPHDRWAKAPRVADERP